MPIRISDPYGRQLTNLRLAITDECNYRCVFCHMEGEPLEGPRLPGKGSPLLRAPDYRIIGEAARLLSISKFKITGGEPLVRSDAPEIVRSLVEAVPGAEVSMTTNGYFLARVAGRLAESGLSRVNISIHSLDPEKYKFITGIPGLAKALRGLDSAIDAGLRVKINMVVLRGVNNTDILEMAEFAHNRGAILQLIELHPVGLGARFFRRYHYPLRIVEEELVKRGAIVKRRSLHNRPVYILPNGPVIEIVRPVNNPFFCAGCTRIRIGPYGDIIPCLNWRGPRKLVTPVLRDNTLSSEEKAVRIAQILVDIVASRRPYYMCTLDSCSNGSKPSIPGRLSLPKRKRYEEAKRELERLLTARGALQSRVQG